MPGGNIDPENDDLTLSSMLLGAEEYPSAVQQALCKNIGYLLYRPVSLWSGNAEQLNVGPMGTIASRVFTNLGHYNLYARAYSSDSSAVTIQIEGTTVASGVGTEGTLAAWYSSTEGWHDVIAYSAGTENVSWNLFGRQYDKS